MKMPSYKSGGVKEWFGGITKVFTIKTLEQKRQEMLHDSDMEDILHIFYTEGSNYMLKPDSAMTFERLLNYMRK